MEAVSARRRMMGAVAGLIGLGLVMVYSSSCAVAEPGGRFGSDASLFFRRHLLWLGLGLVAMTAAWSLPQSLWKKSAWIFAAAALGMLVLVRIPGIGTAFNGARRWFRFAGVGFQPSEIAKIALVLCAARLAADRGDRMRSFLGGFVPAMVLVGLFSGLVAIEPDLGTAAFLGMVGVAVFFVGGVRAFHLIPAGALAATIGFAYVIPHFPHAVARLTAFLNPELDPLGSGYQGRQALIGLGAGGEFGTGLGLSQQKLFFLPERQTDFIFAVLGEELGFVGGAAVILLFAWLLWNGRIIVARARDRFAATAGFGLLVVIGLQAALNIAVVSGLLPTKGIGLPFVSFGGSSLVTMLVAVGFLLSVADGVARQAAEQESSSTPTADRAGEGAPPGSEPAPMGSTA